MAGKYWEDRAKLVKEDIDCSLGSDIILSEVEEKANSILMKYKLEEVTEGFHHPEKYLAAQNFLKVKSEIEASKIFQILRVLPKGCSLHSHDLAVTSGEFVYNLTFEPNLYVQINDGFIRLRFFKCQCTDNNWSLVSELRKSDPKFDDYLKSKLTLIVNDPEKEYPNINVVWTAFNNIFIAVIEMLSYKPIWQKYFYQALKELYEDNVRYLEMRCVLPDVYDLDGKIYSAVEVVGLYFETLSEFKHDYPDFWGARLIYAPVRNVNNETMSQYAETFNQLRKTYPDFIAGFDLVGQEDTGVPLETFIPELLALRESGTNFFFHAGETNWNGCTTDSNLYDAVLLNSVRIGHGYAIIKHPVVAKIVKEKKIAIEVCPISNQVLKLVDDNRNHPAAILIANNFPIVVCCDDPSFWGATALSYDWYIAFMGLASKEADLRFLKQLALNSILYSSMEAEERAHAMEKWESDWDNFINNLVLDTYAV